MGALCSSGYVRILKLGGAGARRLFYEIDLTMCVPCVTGILYMLLACL